MRLGLLLNVLQFINFPNIGTSDKYSIEKNLKLWEVLLY